MEVSQRDHVLHAFNRGRVHGLDTPLWREPLILAIIVFDLYLAPFYAYDSCSDGNVELAAPSWLNPNVITLEKVKKRLKKIGSFVSWSL